MANGKAGAPVGNTNGAKGKLFTEALRKLIKQDELTLVEEKRRINKAANKLLDLAADGSEWAVKEFANRIEGKSIQAVEVTGAEGANFLDPANIRNLSPAELDQLKSLLSKAALNV
jgi:hypothetical protein